MTNPLSPWDELVKRLEKLEGQQVTDIQTQHEITKGMLDEMRSIWKVIQELQSSVAQLEMKVGVKPFGG